MILFYKNKIWNVHKVQVIDPYATLIGTQGMEQKSTRQEDPNETGEINFEPDPIWQSMRNFRLPSGGVLIRGKEIKVPIPIEPINKPSNRRRNNSRR